MWQKNWWQGRRGEWYVVVQAALLLLIVLGPSSGAGASPWVAPYDGLGKLCGGLLMVAGMVLGAMAGFHLGDNLTPLPHPKDDATLTVSGPYRLVRHPIYSGIIFAALGWALWLNGEFTLGYALLLLVFFDVKSRREEEWLTAKFPDYHDYQQRVRKLIPFVY